MNKKGIIIALIVIVFGLVGYILLLNQDIIKISNSTNQKVNSSVSSTEDTTSTKFSVNSGTYAGLTSHSLVGDFAYLKSNVLWIVGNGNSPKEVTILPNDPGGFDYTYPSISADGKQIAYFASNQFVSKAPNVFRANPSIQLWVIKNDGTGKKMVADLTEKYSLTQYGLFPLIPVTWSIDNTKLYALVVPGRDHGVTSQGMISIDMKTGAIEKTIMPDVVGIGHVSFSPDRSQIAYVTFNPGQGYTDWKPPYTIGIADLKNKTVKTLLQSNTDLYGNVIWSPDGKALTYSINKISTGGIFNLNITTNEFKKIFTQTTLGPVYPIAWLSNNTIAYDVVDYSSGPDSASLYTMNTDGTDNKLIASNGDGNILTLLGIKLP